MRLRNVAREPVIAKRILVGVHVPIYRICSCLNYGDADRWLLGADGTEMFLPIRADWLVTSDSKDLQSVAFVDAMGRARDQGMERILVVKEESSFDALPSYLFTVIDDVLVT